MINMEAMANIFMNSTTIMCHLQIIYPNQKNYYPTEADSKKKEIEESMWKSARLYFHGKIIWMNNFCQTVKTTLLFKWKLSEKTLDVAATKPNFCVFVISFIQCNNVNK